MFSSFDNGSAPTTTPSRPAWYIKTIQEVTQKTQAAYSFSASKQERYERQTRCRVEAETSLREALPVPPHGQPFTPRVCGFSDWIWSFLLDADSAFLCQQIQEKKNISLGSQSVRQTHSDPSHEHAAAAEVPCRLGFFKLLLEACCQEKRTGFKCNCWSRILRFFWISTMWYLYIVSILPLVDFFSHAHKLGWRIQQ